jgi:hypothetical protein
MSENALLEYESAQVEYPMEALADSGDNTTFDTQATLLSGRSGFEPVVRPNGLATGGVVRVAVSASNDVVDVDALSCWLAGVKTSVAADLDVAITRPATDVSKVNSITVTAGGAIAVVAGTDGSDQTFTETRGQAGGPPLIPVDSIEIAQVRLTTSAAAVVASNEILRQIGVHVEMFGQPGYEISYVDGKVVFNSALPAIHTGNVPKQVFASYSEALMSDAGDTSDFVPPEKSFSVNSQKIYRKTKASKSESLGNGSFNYYHDDGITDPLLQLVGEKLWFRFYQDQYKTPHLLTQSTLGISRSFPAEGVEVTACTLTPDSETVGQDS